MQATWLIVTNATRAFIYDITPVNVEHKKKYCLIKKLFHDAGRAKNQELVSDKSGAFKGSSDSIGNFSSSTQAHEIELKKFAREITDFLEHAYQARFYQNLIICAEPHFYGVLGNTFSETIKKIIYCHIPKDYVPLPAHELDDVVKEIQRDYAAREC